jgi:beta-ribofuranosylaminobenzene 5'-phosphate synthase
MVTVETGGRIHLGFQNLSLAHERLYGGIGVALDQPRLVVEATPADAVHCEDDLAREYAARATELLSVSGARICVSQTLPRHVGLGSGTQLALAVYTAIAEAYDRSVDVRSAAPELGRGGRSGVGVASFEQGGFIVDGGHPTTRFTSNRPADGQWTVPPLVSRHALPDEWRVVLVIPAISRGKHGEEEERSMRSIVETATPSIADDVTAVVLRRLMPAAATGDLSAFGAAVEDLERLNGAWYADEQGGVFRPPIGTIVETLGSSDAIAGAGQSSWGPTVYGLTEAERVGDATTAAEHALGVADIDGDILVSSIDTEGARINGSADGIAPAR